jgi:hypothetical protein
MIAIQLDQVTDGVRAEAVKASRHLLGLPYQ